MSMHSVQNGNLLRSNLLLNRIRYASRLAVPLGYVTIVRQAAHTHSTPQQTTINECISIREDNSYLGSNRSCRPSSTGSSMAGVVK